MRTAIVGTQIMCPKIRAVTYRGILFIVIVSLAVSSCYCYRYTRDDTDEVADPGTIPPFTQLPKERFICPAQPFRNNSTANIHWNEAKAGEIAITNRPCLQPNGLPLTRKCKWRPAHFSSSWEDASSNLTECVTQTREKLITNTLVDLEEDAFVKNKTQPAEATKRLKRILRAGDYKLIPTDVHFTCRIIQRAVARAKTADLCLNLLSIYNRLMGADKDILRASTVFNSTNKLLANFETCIDATSREKSMAAISTEDQIEGINLSQLGVRAHLSENLSVFYIDPQVANVTGLALYDQHRYPQATGIFREAFGDFYYRFIRSDETLKVILKEKGLEMASYVPYDLWSNLTKRLPLSTILIVKVYSNDAFFMEARLNTTRKVFSKIASLTVPGVTGTFQGLLPMIFRNHNTGPTQKHPATGCGYWNYDSWVSDGIELIQVDSGDSNLIACGSHHMTQFAYLIGGDYRHNDFSEDIVISKVHLRALNIITLVGCTLSIVGLLGIFITSIVFKSWRSKASTKVLLHMCAAVLFQMVLFCFVNTHDMTIQLMEGKNYAGCVAVGALMQYSVLVQFTWMLLVAFLHFQRYVQVFGSRPKHFILKSSIVGWGVPVIPPVILIAADRSSFIPFQDRDSSVMCYPSGNGLNFGVILPVAIIISANLVIFVMVIWSIHHTMQVSSKRTERTKILQQIRLMVMMFFLFGFSWIFGLLAAVDAGLAFSYLFCITATLQGFVLFVYFVILDPATRKLWHQLYSNSEEKANRSETTGLRSTSSH